MTEEQIQANKLFNAIYIEELRQQMDDIVCPLMTDEQLLQYKKLRLLERLYEEAKDAGIIFTWEEAHKRGWLCRWAYDVFPELESFRSALRPE